MRTIAPPIIYTGLAYHSVVVVVLFSVVTTPPAVSCANEKIDMNTENANASKAFILLLIAVIVSIMFIFLIGFKTITKKVPSSLHNS